MSTLQIEETFSVAAPLAAVWRFVSDPNRVAACLPGAQLTGQDGANTFLGTMKVKVGPVMTDFKGRATLSEVDEQAHSLRLTGSGDDKSGGGSAKLAMKLSVSALAADSSQVSVQADVELAGKLVRFGRGMIEAVSKQMFKQFVERARERILESPAEPPAPIEPPAPVAAPPSPVAEAHPITASPDPAPSVAPADPVPPPPSPAVASPADRAPSPPPSTVVVDLPKRAPVELPDSDVSTGVMPRPVPRPLPAKPAEPEALDAGALVFTVFWQWLKSLFLRLLGRAPRP